MSYLNDFHKQQTEQGRRQTMLWSRKPRTIEQVRAQQTMLDKQRAAREAKVNEQ